MSLPIYQRVAVTDAGDVIPGAEYTVINENTGVAAPIYSDRTGATLLTAPYFADSVGTIQFFIAQGTTFRVAASGGVGTYTDRYVYGVAEAVLVQADGNVGIGTSSPTAKLSLNQAYTTGGTYLDLDFNQSNFGTRTSKIRHQIDASGNGGSLVFSPNPNGGDATERARLDSAGNLLVGTTDSVIFNESSGSNGAVIDGANGAIQLKRNNEPGLLINRTGTDGSLINLYKNGIAFGTLAVSGGNNISIGSTSASHAGILFATTVILPMTAGVISNGSISLGDPNYRFDTIYLASSPIVTSDRNQKQDILEITTSETAVATACKGLMRSFRLKDAVAKKGDDARIHFGIMAQDLQDAFTAEGLDAGRYGMFISKTWWETQTEVTAFEAVEEVIDEDGNVTTEAVEAKDAYTRTDTFETLAEAPAGATERTRLGVRYSELLAFIIAAL